MDRVVIIGADGFGEAVADILMSQPLGPSVPAPIGFLDDNPQVHGRAVLGLRVLGPVLELAKVPHDAVVVAIADNDLRRRCCQRLLGAVHPAAVVARRVTLAESSLVAAGAIVGAGCAIGQGAILDAGCVFRYGCQVGAFAYVGPGAKLGFDVVVKDLANIGAAATVVPGQRIGLDARVAPHALVGHDVPEGGAVLSTVSPGYSARNARRSRPRLRPCPALCYAVGCLFCWLFELGKPPFCLTVVGAGELLGNSERSCCEIAVDEEMAA